MLSVLNIIEDNWCYSAIFELTIDGNKLHITLVEAALIIFVFNIPFGYWRANVRKFSFQWALSIHIPVPFVIAIRLLSGIGFAFITYPVIVGAFFFGQFTGSKIYHLLKKSSKINVTSFIISDLVNLINSSNSE